MNRGNSHNNDVRIGSKPHPALTEAIDSLCALPPAELGAACAAFLADPATFGHADRFDGTAFVPFQKAVYALLDDQRLSLELQRQGPRRGGPPVLEPGLPHPHMGFPELPFAASPETATPEAEAAEPAATAPTLTTVCATLRGLDAAAQANLLSTLRLASAVSSAHELRTPMPSGFPLMWSVNTVLGLVLSPDPETVYHALLLIAAEAATGARRFMSSQMNPSLQGPAAALASAVAGGGCVWPSPTAVIAALGAEDDTEARKMAASIAAALEQAPRGTEGEAELDAAAALVAENTAAALRGPDPVSALRWALRCRLVAFGLMPRETSTVLVSQTHNGRFFRDLGAEVAVAFRPVVSKPSLAGVAADCLLMWALTEELAELPTPAGLAVTPWHTALRAIIDGDVSYGDYSPAGLDCKRLYDSAVLFTSRTNGNTRRSTVQLLVGVLYRNPLLSTRNIIGVLTEDRGGFTREDRGRARLSTAVAAGFLGALTNVVRTAMRAVLGWPLLSVDDAVAAAADPTKLPSIVSLDAIAALDFAALSARGHVSMSTAIEAMTVITQISVHETVNPVRFLLEDRELLLYVSRLLDPNATVPLGAAVASGLLSACTHHSMRDVVPALMDRGVLKDILGHAATIAAAPERYPDIFATSLPPLLNALAIHGLAKPVIAAEAPTIVKLQRVLLVAPEVMQQRYKEQHSRGGCVISLDGVFPELALNFGRDTTELMKELGSAAALHVETVASLKRLGEVITETARETPELERRQKLTERFTRPVLALLAFVGGCTGREQGRDAPSQTAFHHNGGGKALAAIFESLLASAVCLDPPRAVAQFLRSIDSNSFGEVWQVLLGHGRAISDKAQRFANEHNARSKEKDAEADDDAEAAAEPAGLSHADYAVLAHLMDLTAALDGAQRRESHVHTARERLLRTVLDAYVALRAVRGVDPATTGPAPPTPRRPETLRHLLRADNALPSRVHDYATLFFQEFEQLMNPGPDARSLVGRGNSPDGFPWEMSPHALRMSVPPVLVTLEDVLPDLKPEVHSLEKARVKLDMFVRVCATLAARGAVQINETTLSKAFTTIVAVEERSGPCFGCAPAIVELLLGVLRELTQARMRNGPRRRTVATCLVTLLQLPWWNEYATVPKSSIARYALEVLAATCRDKDAFAASAPSETPTAIRRPRPAQGGLEVPPDGTPRRSTETASIDLGRSPVASRVGNVAIEELVAAGFSPLQASVALEETDFDTEMALEWLARNPNVTPSRLSAQQRRDSDDAPRTPREAPPSPPELLSRHACTWGIQLLVAAATVAEGAAQTPTAALAPPRWNGDVETVNAAGCRLFHYLGSTHRLSHKVATELLAAAQRAAEGAQLTALTTALHQYTALLVQRGSATLRACITRNTGLVPFLTDVVAPAFTEEAVSQGLPGKDTAAMHAEVCRTLAVLGTNSSGDHRMCDHFARGYCWHAHRCVDAHNEAPHFIRALDSGSVEAAVFNATEEYCRAQAGGKAPEAGLTNPVPMNVHVASVSFIDQTACVGYLVGAMCHEMGLHATHPTPDYTELSCIPKAVPLLCRLLEASPPVAARAVHQFRDDTGVACLLPLLERYSECPSVPTLWRLLFDDGDAAQAHVFQHFRRFFAALLREDQSRELYYVLDKDTAAALDAAVAPSPAATPDSTPLMFPARSTDDFAPPTPLSARPADLSLEKDGKQGDHEEAHKEAAKEAKDAVSPHRIAAELVEFLHDAEAVRQRYPAAFAHVYHHCCVLLKAEGPTGKHFIALRPKRPTRQWRAAWRHSAQVVFAAAVRLPPKQAVRVLSELSAHAPFAGLVVQPPPKIAIPAPLEEVGSTAEHPPLVDRQPVVRHLLRGSAELVGDAHCGTLFGHLGARQPSRAVMALVAVMSDSIAAGDFVAVRSAAVALELLKTHSKSAKATLELARPEVGRVLVAFLATETPERDVALPTLSPLGAETKERSAYCAALAAVLNTLALHAAPLPPGASHDVIETTQALDAQEPHVQTTDEDDEAAAPPPGEPFNPMEDDDEDDEVVPRDLAGADGMARDAFNEGEDEGEDGEDAEGEEEGDEDGDDDDDDDGEYDEGDEDEMDDGGFSPGRFWDQEEEADDLTAHLQGMGVDPDHSPEVLRQLLLRHTEAGSGIPSFGRPGLFAHRLLGNPATTYGGQRRAVPPDALLDALVDGAERVVPLPATAEHPGGPPVADSMPPPAPPAPPRMPEDYMNAFGFVTPHQSRGNSPQEARVPPPPPPAQHADATALASPIGVSAPPPPIVPPAAVPDEVEEALTDDGAAEEAAEPDVGAPAEQAASTPLDPLAHFMAQVAAAPSPAAAAASDLEAQVAALFGAPAAPAPAAPAPPAPVTVAQPSAPPVASAAPAAQPAAVAPAEEAVEPEGAAAAEGGNPPWSGALDPAFLGELPPEMRGDILREHFPLLRRPLPHRMGDAPDGRLTRVHPAFLELVTAEVQAELFALEARVLELEAANAAPVADAGGALAMSETAAMIASLPPDLRREVLMDCELAELQGAPELLAEAQALRAAAAEATARAMQQEAEREAAARREEMLARHQRMRDDGPFASRMGYEGTRPRMPPSRRRPNASRPLPAPAVEKATSPALTPPVVLSMPIEEVCRAVVRPLFAGYVSEVFAVLRHVVRDVRSAHAAVRALCDLCTTPMGPPTARLLASSMPAHMRSSVVVGAPPPLAVVVRVLHVLQRLSHRDWFVRQLLFRPMRLADSTTVQAPAQLGASADAHELAAVADSPLVLIARVALVHPALEVQRAVQDVLHNGLQAADKLVLEDKPPENLLPPGAPANGTPLAHPRHEHPLYWSDPCRTDPRYRGSSFLCNLCGVQSVGMCFHCAQCSCDVCPQCATEHSTTEEHGRRLTRQLLLLSEHTDIIESFVALVLQPGGCPALAESCIDTLQRMMRAQQLPEVEQEDNFPGDRAIAVDKALAAVADAISRSIATAVPQFDAACASIDTTSSANAANRVLALLELDAAPLRSQAPAMFVLQALRPTAQPMALRNLWRNVAEYFGRMSAVLATVTERQGLALPQCALPLLAGFAKYHLQAQIEESRANLGERTETEMLLADSDFPSTVSNQACDTVQQLRQDQANRHAAPAPVLPTQPEPLPPMLHRFVESNRAAINVAIRSNPQLLLGSLAFMKRAPRLIDFEFKQREFRNQVQQMQRTHEQLSLRLSRENVFAQTFAELRGRQANQLRGPINIKFRGEDGVDAGGLMREWFQLLGDEIVNSDYTLFIHSSEGMTFQPNPHSDVNADHLSYFKFAGRVIGLAVYNEVPVDVHFTRSLYRHLIGVEPGLMDLESIDPAMFKSIAEVLRLDHDEHDLGLNFTITHERFGEVKEEELIEGGRDIDVCNDNKKDYVRRWCSWRMTKLIEQQLAAFLTGFYEIVPRELIAAFTEHELELVISGLPEFDVEDLRVNTEYQGYGASSPQVRWFWECVCGMTKQDRANLLQFATGASKVPPGGFSNLEGMSGKTRFSIVRVDSNTDMLPVAHTCFNRIDLPPYETSEKLREKLMVAITYGSKGFSLV